MSSSEQILGDVDHLEVHLEIRILVLEGVVAVGEETRIFFTPLSIKVLMFSLASLLNSVLIAGLADAFSAAVLLGTQDPEIYPGFLEDLDGGSAPPSLDLGS
ncbi:MAG: hypothetical protein MZU95_11395 [Desulfomicrobium escambiense]|nr:hypothetical protein [Desulfomicrobium escambiense]